MELQHVNIKLLAKGPDQLDLAPIVPIFHSWIQSQALEGQLLDVADYRHVTAGPGVVLIGHEGDYSIDNTDSLLGVRYNRKAPFDGTNRDRLMQAVCSVLKACQRLEEDAALQGKIRFNGQEVDLFINDRMLAPNYEETRQRLDPEFKAFFDTLFRGGDYSMIYDTDPRHLLRISVRASRLFTVSDLIRNLVP